MLHYFRRCFGLFTSSQDGHGDASPAANIDGTPMIGVVDANGCPFGSPAPHLHDDGCSNTTSSWTLHDSWSTNDSWSSDSCGGSHDW